MHAIIQFEAHTPTKSGLGSSSLIVVFFSDIFQQGPVERQISLLGVTSLWTVEGSRINYINPIGIVLVTAPALVIEDQRE